MAQMTDSAFKTQLMSNLPTLRAFAISIVGKVDRADDLVQETLMKAWANRASFAEGTNMRAWLFTILRNEFYSVFRKRRREVEDADGQIAASVGVAPEQHSKLDFQDLKTALLKLPVDQREALLLVSASDMSYEEPPKCVASPWGRSRAASVARVAASSNSWVSATLATSAWSRASRPRSPPRGLASKFLLALTGTLPAVLR